MMELPETVTIGRQAARVLAGRTVTDVLPPTYRPKFTFFNGDAEAYRTLLVGRRVLGAQGHGIFAEVRLEEGVILSVGDGISMRYGAPGSAVSAKCQLLLTFDDESLVAFTTRMYGGIYVFRNTFVYKCCLYFGSHATRRFPLRGGQGKTKWDVSWGMAVQ